MLTIPLNKGLCASVDEEDYNRLSQYNWFAMHHRSTTYAIRRKMIQGVNYTFHMHREVLNPDKNKVVDHIDGNGLNNCKNNLRECTSMENSWNRSKQKNNTSGYKGVSFHKLSKKWRAALMFNGAAKYLGIYKSPEEAHRAYKKASKLYHGEFAKL